MVVFSQKPENLNWLCMRESQIERERIFFGKFCFWTQIPLYIWVFIFLVKNSEYLNFKSLIPNSQAIAKNSQGPWLK